MCAPDAPDTSRQDAIAAKAQQMSEDQWAWVQKQYEAEKPNRDAATSMARQVSQAQLDQMKKSGALADESAGDYRRIYRPLEEQAAQEAAGFDSAARQEQAAGRAVADVNSQADIQRGAAQRNALSMGVNPNDGAFAAADAELRNQQALQGAQAATAARDRVQTVGRAMRQDAIGVGRGVVSSQGTQAGLTLTAGSNAAGTAQIPGQISTQGIQTMGQANGQAVNGLMGAANIYTNSSRMQNDANIAASQAQAGLAGAAMKAAALFA